MQLWYFSNYLLSYIYQNFYGLPLGLESVFKKLPYLPHVNHCIVYIILKVVFGILLKLPLYLASVLTTQLCQIMEKGLVSFLCICVSAWVLCIEQKWWLWDEWLWYLDWKPHQNSCFIHEMKRNKEVKGKKQPWKSNDENKLEQKPTPTAKQRHALTY